jgi:hypothetical protein
MKRLALAVALVLLSAAVLWLYSRRDELRLQWACYEVASAPTYEIFKERLEQFDRGPDAQRRQAALVERWHTGNTLFDDHLARYLYDPNCREDLRETFSRELSWREELIAIWGERWRTRQSNHDEQIESLRRYLEVLHAAQPPRAITWREVLDFQAAVEITGHGSLAHRLTPENWRSRYERWQEALAQASSDR